MKDKNKNIKLEEILDKVIISEEDKHLLQSNELFNQIKDFVFDSTMLLKIVKKFIDYHDNIEKQIKESKKEILLTEIFNKVKEHEHLLKSYISLLAKPEGIYLLNKILNNDRNHFDDSFQKYNEDIIINIIKTDFKKLLNIHDYYINLINKLSKISLKILLNNNWPVDIQGPRIHTGDMVIANWEKRISEEYAKLNNVQNQIEIDVIQQCIFELRDNRIIEYSIKENAVDLTESGKNLIVYFINKL